MEIEIEKYLSEAEIKNIVSDQIRYEVSEFFKTEKNAQRLLSNLSYEIVFNEIDKVIPNSRELVISKTKTVLNDIKNYQVFRDASYGSDKSLGYKIMEESVKYNKDLINEKVKETITSKDYSKEIWDRYEAMAESFMSNFYEIARLGRENK